ncbi:MAG: RNA polymerase sigma factor [Phycisphaerales bacterium]
MDQSDRKPAARDAEPVAASTGDDRLAGLLRDASNGDEEAWRAIVHLYARRVYALVRSRLVPRFPGRSGTRPLPSAPDSPWAGAMGHDIAEEVTQSVFVTIATKLSTGEYTERGRFESWLFRVAMNRIRDEARRTRRQATPTDPETLDTSRASSAPDDRPDAIDDLDALRRALGELSDADREIIELRHHAGLSFKQMADLLSEPLGTLLARHHRALRKLKDLITGNAASPAHAAEERP